MSDIPDVDHPPAHPTSQARAFATSETVTP